MGTLRELELAQASPRLLELLRRQGFASLSKFQAEAVNKGILRRMSKILMTYDYEEAYDIAEIAVLNTVTSDSRARVLVLCPNPHRAEKVFHSISQGGTRLGVETTSIIRRRFATDPDLRIGRVIVATIRALGISLQTHPEILEGLQCVLIDRLDLIGQPDIGATLESILVALKGLSSDIQYISICPPVADIKELSTWLKSEIIEDRKADVRRIYGVRAFEDVNESLSDLTEYVHRKRGQVMILCASAKESEKLASILSGIKVEGKTKLNLNLTLGHQDELRELSQRVRMKYPTCELSILLGKVLPKGVSFFHEGVSRAQRRMISHAWEDGLLPVIVMPTRFAISSGLKASSVFLMGVYMEDKKQEEDSEENLTLLSEWELSDVLHSAGRSGIDSDAFGIVVVGNEDERQRVILKYFVREQDGSIIPRLGEVDSNMDDSEAVQDLVLGQLCVSDIKGEDSFSILSRTYWAATKSHESLANNQSIKDPIAATRLYISNRATKSVIARAAEIEDSSVRLVSVTPQKVEGLIHSASRDLWHHVILRAKEGVSCTCESWKFQGIRRHRLCKHLVKFINVAIQKEGIAQYAVAVIDQSLRGLEILEDLEREGLVFRENRDIDCTESGKTVAMLGIPVSYAKRVKKALSKKDSKLRDILLELVTIRTDIPSDVWKRVIDETAPGLVKNMEYCAVDSPGVIENCLEEIQYLNTILSGLVGKDQHSLISEIKHMNQRLDFLISGFS